jgi:hypothetical protein
MEKYIPVKTNKDQQSLTEFLNKGWVVKHVNPVKYYYADDIDTTKTEYNEYIISDELINKPVTTTNEQLTNQEKAHILKCLEKDAKQNNMYDPAYYFLKNKLIV